MAKDKPTEQTVSERNAQQVADELDKPAAEPELTIEQLMAQMQTAITNNDFKAVSQISRKIDTRNRAVEKAALDEKRAMAEEVGNTVMAAIMEVVQPLVDDGTLDNFDGVWFTNDFGEQQPTIRLVKTATKARSSGNGGTGKKFDVSTEDMLSRHGTEQYKDTGQTISEAYNSNTDKNWRYAIRTKLLKLEGII